MVYPPLLCVLLLHWVSSAVAAERIDAGAGEVAKGPDSDCLTLYGVPEPAFDPGVDPGPGAAVWCGGRPEPLMLGREEMLPERQGACEVVTDVQEQPTLLLRRSTFAFDLAGRVVEARDEHRVVRSVWSSEGKLQRREWRKADSAEALVAVQVFEPDGRPLLLDEVDGGFVRWKYTGDGRLLGWEQRRVAPAAHVRVVLDAEGSPSQTEVIREGGAAEETRVAFDAAARLYRITRSGPEPAERTLRCDVRGRVIEEHGLLDVTLSPWKGVKIRVDAVLRYDASGQLVLRRGQGLAGTTTRFAYDAGGRRILSVAVEDAPGSKIRRRTFAWDAAGRQLCTDAAFTPSFYSGPGTDLAEWFRFHDACGPRLRIVHTRNESGEVATVQASCVASGAPYRATRHDYEVDARGRITKEKVVALNGDILQVKRFRYDCHP